MEFKKVVQRRRSIRSFSDKQVEEEKIKYVLECARWAPSARNQQCWDFIIVKNSGTIQKLGKASHVINRWLKKAPVVIVACGDPKKSTVHNNMEYYLVDVAIAMEHLVLAAADKKLGSCWLVAFDEKQVKQILDIPKRIRVVALTPLGYPAEKKGLWQKTSSFFTKSKRRKKLDDITHRERW